MQTTFIFQLQGDVIFIKEVSRVHCQGTLRHVSVILLVCLNSFYHFDNANHITVTYNVQPLSARKSIRKYIVKGKGNVSSIHAMQA